MCNSQKNANKKLSVLHKTLTQRSVENLPHKKKKKKHARVGTDRGVCGAFAKIEREREGGKTKNLLNVLKL